MNGEILSRFKCDKPPRSKWGYAVCYDHASVIGNRSVKWLHSINVIAEECQVKRRSTPQIIKSDQDSYGITRCLDEEHAADIPYENASSDEVDIIKRLLSFTSKRWTYNDPLTAKYNAKMAGMRPIAKPKGSSKLKDWEQP